jgi:hypothetical protein
MLRLLGILSWAILGQNKPRKPPIQMLKRLKVAESKVGTEKLREFVRLNAHSSSSWRFLIFF